MRENARDLKKMPGAELDESHQLDEILRELLNDEVSPPRVNSKRWPHDIKGQQSGSITTQSGNSRTIISWQTSQAGPKKSLTVTKQMNGNDVSRWNGKPDEGPMDGRWKREDEYRVESSKAFQLQTKREDSALSTTEFQLKEGSGKASKTPPPPPVRRRLVSADELGMGLVGSSPGRRVGWKREDVARRDLARNCASDSEETRSWLDEQMWKLQAKKTEKSYQQHTRLEKQLISDLKCRLGSKYTQSDTEECFATSPREKTAPRSVETKALDHFGGSHDEDVTSSKTSSHVLLDIRSHQSDVEDSRLASAKQRLLGQRSDVTSTFNWSADDVTKATSPTEVPLGTSYQGTTKREPVRSFSFGDDPGKPTYKTKASFYVSGIERPAFSTHQTKYTFSVNPICSDDSQNKSKPPPVPPPRSSAPTSPVIPKRGDSSRDAIVRSQRKMVYSPSLDELENSLCLILEQPAPTLTTSEKDVTTQRKVTTPVKDVDDEVIILKPIGPGVQTLEPDKTGTLKRPMTPLIPVSVSNNNNSSTLNKGPVSPNWTSADNVSRQHGQFNQEAGQGSVHYSTETLQKTQLSQTPLVTPMSRPIGSSDTLLAASLQQLPWQQQQQLWQQQQLPQQQLQLQQQQPWQQQQLPLQPLQLQQPQRQQPPQSWQQQQPWQQHQQQSWQYQTWQQSWPLQQQQQQLQLHPQMQQPYGTLNNPPQASPFNQYVAPVQVTSQTAEYTHQTIVQNPSGPGTSLQFVQPHPVGVHAVQNNPQFDVHQQGTSLLNRQQNQQVSVQSVRQSTAQQHNVQRLNQQQLNSQQYGVQQSITNTQPLSNQPMGVQTTATQPLSSQPMGVQTAATQPLTGGQEAGFQQMNVQQKDAYVVAPQFVQQSVQPGVQLVLQPGVQQGVQPDVRQTGVRQESAKYVTVEQKTSSQPLNTMPQESVHASQLMQVASVQNQGQQAQQQMQQQVQQQMQQQVQQQMQQQKTYSTAFQSSAADQVQSGRQTIGGSMTLDNRTRSPVPLGSPSSGGSWPSVGYNDTLRSQTLQTKKTDLGAAQSTSYDTLMRTRSPALMRSVSPASVYNGQFVNGSLVSLSDGIEYASTMPRFVRDMSKYWHKPNLTREEAISLLKDKPPGSFVVRNSNTFQGGYGLALKVAQLPPNVQAKCDDPQANLVRHFLIESSSKGVRLKGCSNEPVFGSLAALIYQHSITPLALPCKLLLPSGDGSEFDETDKQNTDANLPASVSNTLYIDSIDTESLTGPEALSKAIGVVFGSRSAPPRTTSVQFKVSYQGITLTDSKHRLFFRRHYPLNTVTFCGVDGKDRRWTLTGEDNVTVSGKLFGFIARKSCGGNDNACHLFLDPENGQSAGSIVELVTKVMMGQGQFMKA